MTNWKFFVLGKDRTPLPNCPRCASQSSSFERHDPEVCTCLTCHGFYAATDNMTAMLEMAEKFPYNQWAVRTGRASGIVVIDVEGPTKDPNGYESLERWADFTGFHLPDVTLQAQSPSGGLHLYFEFPGINKIPSRNRVLPGIDLKADGGYVVIPHANSPGRIWERRGSPTIPSLEMASWLVGAKGSSAGGMTSGFSFGYDYHGFLRDGCPEGNREEFFNDLIFRLRKRGVTYQDAYDEAREQWLRCQQPEGVFPGAKWYWAWEHVEYKLRRIFNTVEVETPPEWQSRWVSSLNDRAQPDASGWPTGRRGRATIV